MRFLMETYPPFVCQTGATLKEKGLENDVHSKIRSYVAILFFVTFWVRLTTHNKKKTRDGG